MAKTFHELAFTDAVRAMQEKQGSAAMYARSLAPEAPADDRLGPTRHSSSPCATASTKPRSAPRAGPMCSFAAARAAF
ncbi:hypothetical protein [Roseovarius confluentis]|uniref:hypothetical protein n=1 Tax=Roseovarius confluentis TaxID=1852027 RepID=UPI001FE79CE7|nr:hypothetical protein [Roseovarius confluentis]